MTVKSLSPFSSSHGSSDSAVRLSCTLSLKELTNLAPACNSFSTKLVELMFKRQNNHLLIYSVNHKIGTGES